MFLSVFYLKQNWDLCQPDTYTDDFKSRDLKFATFLMLLV